MTNADIARVLTDTAQLMALAGENAFKARAYETAADAIEAFAHPVHDLVNAGRALEIEGVGKSIAQSLREILDTGTFAKREELLATVPRTVLELSRIKGLGPKKVQQLWQELNIAAIADLESALRSGQLDTVKGFGDKTKAALLEAIAFYTAQRGRRRLPEALKLTQALLPRLLGMPGIAQAAPTGQLLRSLPVIEALEFVVAVAPGTLSPEGLLGHLSATQATYLPHGAGYGTYTCTHAEGFTFRLIEVPEGTLEASVLAYAYPPDTPQALQRQLSAYPPEAWDWLAGHPEALPTAPTHLVSEADIRGILHAHSTWSDGQHTLRAMAEACLARGYGYLGITDHSRTAAYAGGLSIERVAAQHAEIDALNAELAPFRIFKGIESDILPDGSLDYPDTVLASFDFVIGSIHSGFAMTEAQATDRLVRAAQNPYCTLLGHPTGRLLLARPGYPVNLARVIDACAEAGTAIELNSHPYRLDLDWEWQPYARERGVPTSLNPDAHSTQGLADVQWGVRAARKGLVTPDGCLCCLDTQQLADYFTSRRARAKS